MAAAIPRPAATVILIRDGAQGIEILMMKRNLNSAFVPGAHVFPGGSLDADDGCEAASQACGGYSDEEASRRLGLARGGLAYWNAAIREAFEEAGVLFAYDCSGSMIALDDESVAQRFKRHRDALNQRKLGFSEILREEQLTLAADRLVYYSHWITPANSPRRFDTRFFVAMAPDNQEPLHDNQEMVDHLWISPRDALRLHKQGDFQMRLPTVTTLKEFSRFDASAAAMEAAMARRNVPRLLPVITASGRRYMPGDPGYEEAAREAEE